MGDDFRTNNKCIKEKKYSEQDSKMSKIEEKTKERN
jgi:hypothetical protein